MKNKNKVISIIFFSAFIVIVSYGQQKIEWKGTIEEMDKITIVKNTK